MIVRGGEVSKIIKLGDRVRGGGGVWSRPKYDHKILEQALKTVDKFNMVDKVL